MLRILRTVPFFAPAYGFGGPVVHTLNLSKIQVKMGHDVRVFTSNIDNEGLSKDLKKFEVLKGIKVHRFPVKLDFGHYLISPKLPLEFFKYKYDLIHSHSYRTFQTDVSTFLSRIKLKPFIFTAHGTLRNMYLLKLFQTKKKEATRMKMYDIFMKGMFLEAVDKIIVHSEHEKFWTLKFNVPEKKIAVVPHGVNLQKFTNIHYKRDFLEKFKPNGKMILYVGRLFRNYRNLKLLISVMKDVVKEIKNVQLWLIGHSYDKEYESELRKLVKDFDLGNHIIFITNPSRSDILGAYQNANLVVFPITESDGFGIPILEAGASRCPIISTKRGPALELVKDGRTGFLTRKDNRNDLKKTILKILESPELERKLGVNAYNNILKNYTWEIITEKTNQIYREVLSNY